MNFSHTWSRLGILLALLLTAGNSPAVIRDGGIDSKNVGRGTWIYILPNAISGLGGNVPSVNTLSNLMTYLKNQGLQYVGMKAAQADTVFTVGGNPQFTPDVVAAAHAAGLKIFGYIYTTGANVPGEIAMVDYIFQQGADGLIYDAEIEWETVGGSAAARSALAVQLCSTVRSNWPNKFMGLSTWPYRAVHANLPYKEFAYYCDVIMPQAYWIELGDTPTACVTRINNEWNSWKNSLTGIWTNAIKPFIMTGQGWSSGSGTITPEQITEFENACRTIANPVSPGGFKAVDYWRAELHPASIWPAIRTNFLSNPYTNAPAIEYPPATSVGATTASIWWPTDQVSDSIVEYGPSTGYGSATTNATLLWYHNVNLSGLSPNTTYHYRVKSKGTNNLMGVSADYVFTTLSAVVADVVIDQDPANNSGGSTVAYVGSWTANVAGSAYLGNFRYASGNTNAGSFGSPDRTATFTPNIVTAGSYNIFASWAASSVGGNRCTNAPFRIFNGTTSTTRVNQEANGNTFIQIGTNVSFAAGTGGYVRLGNDVTGSWDQGDIVVADAVKFVYVPPPPTPPSIATQPQPQTVNQGNTATFTVVASGTAQLTYQWKHAGTNLPGATASSYVKVNVQPADAGNYSVGITNGIGYSNSVNALLTVNIPPFINAQPQSTNVLLGANVMFTVAATGSPAPTYQWRFNGTNIAGATTTSYTKSNVQFTNAGVYSVVVSNVAATATSDDAVLTVSSPTPPSIDSIVLLPDGRARLQISGGPGNFAIQQSPNFSGWTQAITTNVTGGIFQYTDPETNQAGRFYRAVRLLP